MAARKHRAKNLPDIRRRPPTRDAYQKILIVCEGKTESRYFRAMQQDRRISGVTVKESGSHRSDPGNILDQAKRHQQREQEMSGDPYDKIYCVFDKDDHADYESTLGSIGRPPLKGKFHAINSVPCFEYWLVLHYGCTTRPFRNCDEVIQVLKGHHSDYSKAKDIFDHIRDKTDTAMKNAVQSQRAASANGTDNPTTNVHKLVKILLRI